MLERTDAIMNKGLDPIKFILAYPTVLTKSIHEQDHCCWATGSKAIHSLYTLDTNSAITPDTHL